ncbi:hypothetical protein DFH11DRAFT_1880805 [Phellopilus nigrolimitatus]|nr:hypothetical protein DFH11DRAFT_1880805 [Phellopilus nigrolimitatus]
MSSPPPRAHIAISPTTPAHLPALAACELLAAFPPPCPFMHRAAPFRAPLVRAGVPPELWPDFAGTVRRHAQELRAGALMYTAVLTDAEGGGARRGHGADARPACGGGARTPRRGWTERVLDDYVYPAVGSVRARVGQEADGKDYAFLAAFRGAQAQTQGLFVRPSSQHCAGIADAARAPLVLDAVPARVCRFTPRTGSRTAVRRASCTAASSSRSCRSCVERLPRGRSRMWWRRMGWVGIRMLGRTRGRVEEGPVTNPSSIVQTLDTKGIFPASNPG